MALIAYDGFDLYALDTELADRNWIKYSNATFSTTGGRFGGGALDLGSSVSNYWKYPISQAMGTTMFISCAFKYTNTYGSSATKLFTVNKSSIVLGGLYYNQDNLELWDDTGLVASGGGPHVAPNAWAWLELKIYFGTTAVNGTLTAWVNGTQILSATGLDTNYSSPADNIRFYSTGATNVYYDDVVIYDDQGTTMNAVIGVSKIETLLPNADGGTTSWVPVGEASNYLTIDDPLQTTPDDDTTYINSGTLNAINLAKYSAITDTPVTIHSAQIVSRVSQDITGIRNFRLICKSNITTTNGASQTPIFGSYLYKAENFDLDPNTSAAWLKADLTNAEFGIEVL